MPRSKFNTIYGQDQVRLIKNSKSSPIWGNSQLSSIFATTISPTATTIPTPNVSPTSTSSHHHIAVEPIVGVIIGGVVIVSSLSVLGYWFMKIRRRHPDQPPAIDPQNHLQISPAELEQTVRELVGGDLRPELDGDSRAELDASHDNARIKL